VGTECITYEGGGEVGLHTLNREGGDLCTPHPRGVDLSCWEGGKEGRGLGYGEERTCPYHI
jgi:hypothetical protein